MSTPSIIVIAVLALVLLVVWNKLQMARRADYIRSFALPRGLYDRLRKKRPELTLRDCQLVSRALRQFFLTHLKSGRQFVSMPSQVTDDLWHEFILYTKHYEQFCKRAFGRCLPHTPAVVLSGERQANAGLRRCWWQACRDENINPTNPVRLPLLFAIDTKLNIADGFRYLPDCGSVRREGDKAGSNGAVYCGGDFGSSGFDGGTDGFGDAGTGAGDGGSTDGGGDSGGCGGGCGGGD